MRSLIAVTILVLFTAASSIAADQPAASVAVHRADAEPGRMGPADQAALAGLAMDLVRSSNFNTVRHPEILKQSVPAIHGHYRRVAAGECLVVTYDEPVAVATVGGELSVFEIVVGLGDQDFAYTLFTVDREGRVVGHGKYSGTVLLDLRTRAAGAVNGR